MTLVYHYTTGVNAAGTSGPWDVGRAGVEQLTPPTTRQAMFDAIVEALSGPTGAGWTETAASTASSRIFTSNGESGNENITLLLNQGAVGAPDVRYCGFGLAHSVDAAGVAQNPICQGVTSAGTTLDFSTSDFTFEFQIVANLDWIWVNATRQSNQTPYNMFAGRLRRKGYNDAVLVVNTPGATPGTNVLIPTTSNPIVSGIRVGDFLTVVDQEPTLPPVAENVLVVDVEATGIRVAELVNNISESSRIGAQPNPVVVGHWSGSVNFDDAISSPAGSEWRSVYQFSTPGDPELATSGGEGTDSIIYARPIIVGTTQVAATTERGLGSAATPERRTNRFLCPAVVCMSGASLNASNGPSANEGPNPGKAILGMVPGLHHYPGNVSYFPHDNYVRNRNVTTTEDYIPFRFSTSTNEHHILGPTPL